MLLFPFLTFLSENDEIVILHLKIFKTVFSLSKMTFHLHRYLNICEALASGFQVFGLCIADSMHIVFLVFL